MTASSRTEISTGIPSSLYLFYLKDRETLSSQSIENNGFFTGDIGTIVDMESLKQEGPVKYIGLFELLHGENSNEYLNEGLYASYPHIGPYEDMRKSYQLVLRQLKEEALMTASSRTEISTGIPSSLYPSSFS